MPSSETEAATSRPPKKLGAQATSLTRSEWADSGSAVSSPMRVSREVEGVDDRRWILVGVLMGF